MTGLTVRRAEVSDAKAIAAAEGKYIDCAWTEEQILGEIQSGDAVFLVAEVGDSFVGYLSGVIAADECEISNIAVETEYRRRGVATKLFDELLSVVKSRGVANVFLLVRDGNVGATALYLSLGFTEVGRRRGYYGGADALIMTKSL